MKNHHSTNSPSNFTSAVMPRPLLASMFIFAGTIAWVPAQVIPETASGGGYVFKNLAGWLVESFSGSSDGFSGSGDGFFSGSEAGFSGSVDGFSGSGTGGGLIGNVDGVGSEAMFYQPGGVTVAEDGTIYVSDTGNNAIRKISANGTVTKLAGNFLGSADGNFLGSSDGVFAGSADGNGENAEFKNPQGITIDNDGNILVADRKNHAIRKVTTNGVVSTIAGGFTGSGAYGVIGSSDGAGDGARFHHPSDVAADALGNIYVADSGNHAIRKIDGNGTVTTVAGSLGVSGSTNDTGNAARFNSPQGIAVDTEGNIIVADTTNGLIRKVTPQGAVSTVAGALFQTNGGASFVGSGGEAFTGSVGEGGRSGLGGKARDFFTGSMDAFSGSGDGFTGSSDAFLGSADMGWPESVDGTGDQARFSFPTDVEVDASGNIFVVDSGSGKIRKITPSGVVTTLGGSPDGFFTMPLDIAVSSAGELVVADSGNNRVATTIANAKPVIALIGSSSLTVYLGAGFDDPGATVTDDHDDERSILGTGSVNTASLGNYTLSYSAEDTSGLEADPVTRSVQVIYDPTGDLDGDGLTNSQEVTYGTDPLHFDSDLDGYTDKDEIDAKSDPLALDSVPSAKNIPFKSISDQLIGVTKIRSINGTSFAALTGNGAVIVWGSQLQIPESILSDLSANVTDLVANTGAFAALKGDGSILAWGNATYGGNSSGVSDKINSGITKIVAYHNAFGALKSDGSVVVWGNDDVINSWGTVSSELASGVLDLIGDDLGNYTSNGVNSHGSYFWFYLIAKKINDSEVLLREDGLLNPKAILRRITISGNALGMELHDDGSVVKVFGGPSNPPSPDWPIDEFIPFESVTGALDAPVEFLSSSYAAFAALTSTGKVVTWGDGAGANSSMVASELQSGVIKVINGAWTQWFLALKDNGSVVLWGDTGNNSDLVNPNEEIRNKLKDSVVSVEKTLTQSAIAALKNDGSVVAWGNKFGGGDASSVSQNLNAGVSKLYASGSGFAALKNDGSVVTWGAPYGGGDSSKVANQLASGVVDIHPVWSGFYAIKDTGVVAWGDTVAEKESEGSVTPTNSGNASSGSGSSSGGGSSQVQKSKKGGSKSSSAKKSSSGSKSSTKKSSGSKKSSAKKSGGGSKKSSAKESSSGGKKKSGAKKK